MVPTPDWPLVFDPAVDVALQRALGPAPAPVFHALSALGDTWGLVTVVGAVLWVRGLRDAWGVLLGALFVATLNTPLVALLRVARPSHPDLRVLESLDIPSFPSGHVATAACVWGLLALWRVVPAWVACALVLGIATARLYLGMHYVADVLAGALLGAASARAFALAWPRLASGWQKPWAPRALTWGPLAFVLVAIVITRVGHSPKIWATAGSAAATGLALPFAYRLGPAARPATRGEVAFGVLVAAAGWALARALDAGSAAQQAACAAAVVGSSRVDLQACKLEYSIVSPK